MWKRLCLVAAAVALGSVGFYSIGRDSSNARPDPDPVQIKNVSSAGPRTTVDLAALVKTKLKEWAPTTTTATVAPEPSRSPVTSPRPVPQEVTPKAPETASESTQPLEPGHSEVVRAINEASIEFRVSELLMLSIAKCESTFHPDANNGGHGGLFQQSFRYWPGRVAKFNASFEPDVGGDVFNPFDNARVSAWMLTWPDWRNHWEECL